MTYSSSSSSAARTALPAASTWPTVIGIIAIVLGALGMLGGCFGTLVVFAMDFMRDLLPEGQTSTFDYMADRKPLFAGLAIAGFALAILLLLGGVFTMRRRRPAYMLLFSWLLLKLVYVAGKAPIDFKVGQDQMQAMEQQTADAGQPLTLGAAGDVMLVLGTVMGVAWGIALPLFLLVWLLRRPIRREMGSW